jgi:hypothetical protein
MEMTLSSLMSAICAIVEILNDHRAGDQERTGG